MSYFHSSIFTDPAPELRGRHKEKTRGYKMLLDDFVYNFRRTCAADWTIFFWEKLSYTLSIVLL